MIRQCLKRRIEDIEVLRSELSAWEKDMNNATARIWWQFTTDDARTKLTSLYPKLSFFSNESLRRIFRL